MYERKYHAKIIHSVELHKSLSFRPLPTFQPSNFPTSQKESKFCLPKVGPLSTLKTERFLYFVDLVKFFPSEEFYFFNDFLAVVF